MMSGPSMTKTRGLFSIYPQSQSHLSTVTVHLSLHTGNTSANTVCCTYMSLCVCVYTCARVCAYVGLEPVAHSWPGQPSFSEDCERSRGDVCVFVRRLWAVCMHACD